MTDKTPIWEVVDHDFNVVFDAETITKDPTVVGGLFTPREYAKRLARENSDPMFPPLVARKIA